MRSKFTLDHLCLLGISYLARVPNLFGTKYPLSPFENKTFRKHVFAYTEVNSGDQLNSKYIHAVNQFQRSH